MNYTPAGFKEYLDGSLEGDLQFLQEGVDYSDARWDAAFPVWTRVKAIVKNVVYGVVANGPYWVGSVAFALLMKVLVGGSYTKHCLLYFAASVLTYLLARHLPLKVFSSDGQGTMRPLEAGLRNGIRMLLPFVLAYISSGRIGLYPLVATVVVMFVEAGKHALFHANHGSMWINWTFFTDMLERRIAVSGVNLPANFRVLRLFLNVEPVPKRWTGKGPPPGLDYRKWTRPKAVPEKPAVTLKPHVTPVTGGTTGGPLITAGQPSQDQLIRRIEGI